jgi:hypothetical protein
MEQSDSLIATNIVRKIFKNINSCIQGDRSKIKLNMLEKGMIKGLLTDKSLNGINNYITNMNTFDLKILIDEIEVEIKSRKPK